MNAQRSDPSNHAPAIDRETYEALAEMIGPDTPEVLIELIDIYLSESADLVAAIQARGGGQEQTFLRSVHSLKSSSASIGGKRLSALCADLERYLRNPVGDMDVPGQVEQIVAEHSRVIAELQVEKERLESMA